MKSYFTADFFANNRRSLRQLFSGTAPIVLFANGLLQRGGDSTYAFSQEANFWYLTGIDEPDITLVMDRHDDYLIVPERSVTRQAFDGSIDTAELVRRSGIKAVYNDDEGWQRLGQRVKKVKHVASLVPPPAYVEHYGFYANPARAAMLERLKSYNTQLEIVDIGEPLVNLRMVKQPAELRAIQAAIDITTDSLKEVTRPAKLVKYIYEYEIEAEMSRAFRRRGAGHAFEPIVAGGHSACTLHNVANNARLQPNQLVLLDVGAEIEHYAADISRTHRRGRLTKRQQAVYAAVQEVQQFALSLLKPGALLKENEIQIATFMGEKLRQLGLLRTVNSKNVRRFYPHATSHFMGLNVHDVGDYTRPLEAGMVLTCEPGIYIKKESIGVRIEDDVLITKTGHKVLSAKLPATL